MSIIDIFHDVHVITNLLLLLMLQFFVGIGIGIFLGTEYNFRPYIKFVQGAIHKIERRSDSEYDGDSDSSTEKNSTSWFFGSAKKEK